MPPWKITRHWLPPPLMFLPTPLLRLLALPLPMLPPAAAWTGAAASHCSIGPQHHYLHTRHADRSLGAKIALPKVERARHWLPPLLLPLLLPPPPLLVRLLPPPLLLAALGPAGGLAL